METINVTQEIKNEFEKDRFQIRCKENRLISQDEFVKRLLKNWRKK